MMWPVALTAACILAAGILMAFGVWVLFMDDGPEHEVIEYPHDSGLLYGNHDMTLEEVQGDNEEADSARHAHVRRIAGVPLGSSPRTRSTVKDALALLQRDRSRRRPTVPTTADDDPDSNVIPFTWWRRSDGDDPAA